MSKSKFIPLPEHPAIVRCYICKREFPIVNMLNIGQGKFRCKTHRQSTILKATVPKVDTSVPKTNTGRKWIITIPSMVVEIKEEI